MFILYSIDHAGAQVIPEWMAKVVEELLNRSVAVSNDDDGRPLRDGSDTKRRHSPSG
jgi:hypothetical protein